MPRKRTPTLAVYLQALEGSKVVVELRKDTIVKGTLTSCDEQLNLIVEQATCKPLQGKPRNMDMMYIRGRFLRYVHVPANLEPAAAVDEHKQRVAKMVKQHQMQQAGAAKLQKGVQDEAT